MNTSHSLGHGLHDLRQRLDARRHAVELTAAVVGDDHPGRAVLDREAGVLSGQHPLDQHGQAGTSR